MKQLTEDQKKFEDLLREFTHVSDQRVYSSLVGTEKLKNHFRITWIEISKKFILSEKVIREFQDKVYWRGISQYQKLSEGFIREFQNEVNWHVISQTQILSENFIREFKNKVNWYYISAHQNLSEDFIIEFQGRVYMSQIYQRNLVLSKNFYKNVKNKRKEIIEETIKEMSSRPTWKSYYRSIYGEKVDIPNMEEDFLLYGRLRGKIEDKPFREFGMCSAY